MPAESTEAEKGAVFHRKTHDEEIGVRRRMERYHLPLIAGHCRALGIGPPGAPVLDCGCGNGLSVELPAQAGFPAFGVDLWPVRHEQWKERAGLPRVGLSMAGGRRLPFRDGRFEAVLIAASGFTRDGRLPAGLQRGSRSGSRDRFPLPRACVEPGRRVHVPAGEAPPVRTGVRWARRGILQPPPLPAAEAAHNCGIEPVPGDRNQAAGLERPSTQREAPDSSGATGSRFPGVCS